MILRMVTRLFAVHWDLVVIGHGYMSEASLREDGWIGMLSLDAGYNSMYLKRSGHAVLEMAQHGRHMVVTAPAVEGMTQTRALKTKHFPMFRALKGSPI